ncbi:DUF1772 domain-containing protein [Cohnella thailandensis]|uniref:DUF1772 domain-containing protein n=1 Tax=Cohnella thailandensis TaxID=557557 RepID=A0A841SR88_9BACL|nr:anthrone oxygenase family protein [Cohnella thailandensis]MBB6633419.1 DUF1772 domain-containing protein [Cohnella thailandensis]MBP1977238.1 putative membrane protein [Cohnella thailandensis]
MGILYYLTFASAIGSGLLAGIFFAFSTFVMTALSRLPAEQSISAMQTINTDIVRSLFIAVFMGATVLSVILGIASFFKIGSPSSAYVLAGSVLLFVGAFLVTVVFNVPLNDTLAVADPRSPNGARAWQDYLNGWMPWNHVRTLTSIAALVCFIVAIRKW